MLRVKLFIYKYMRIVDPHVIVECIKFTEYSLKFLVGIDDPHVP